MSKENKPETTKAESKEIEHINVLGFGSEDVELNAYAAFNYIYDVYSERRLLKEGDMEAIARLLGLPLLDRAFTLRKHLDALRAQAAITSYKQGLEIKRLMLDDSNYAVSYPQTKITSKWTTSKHEEGDEKEVDFDSNKEIIYDLLYGKEVEYGIQYLPVSIYLDTEDPETIFKVYTAVLDFLKMLNFDVAVELKDKKGSWIKRMIYKSKEVMGSDEVRDRLKEAEYGIEVNTILKPQSEVEKNQSEALLNITKAVENAPNAAIRIGSLIVVKITNPETTDVQILARTLSIKEVHLLNKKPALLDNPQKLLNALSEITDDTNN